MVLAARDRVRRRTAQRTRLTKMSRRKGPRDQLVCAPCMRAKGTLVSREPKIIAERDHCGFSFSSSGRRGAPVKCSMDQSYEVHRAGRTKPRKAISSKKGARVTPNAKRIHAAPGA